MHTSIMEWEKVKVVNPGENFPYGTACFNIVKIDSDADAEIPISAFHSIEAILDLRV